jgi:predicted dehydrogenase
VNADYMQAGLLFNVKKVMRYIWMYGLSRTLVKIRGQYHLKAVDTFAGTRWANDACRNPDAPMRRVALIGCGNYAFSNIAYYLGKQEKSFLRCAFDAQPGRAMSLCRAYGGAYAATDWHEILADPQVDIVFIASNHATHAEYAVACIDAGKHVHIEKPHVVSQVQLDQLLAAMQRHPAVKVFLGFNRPRSRLFVRLQEFLAGEVGPIMINWFIAGHEIPDGHWYFDDKEGGRILGNLCHWTDLTLHLVGMDKAFPCTIFPATPAGAKSDFMVSVLFADGSCAAVTFSAKGQTFEGVREVLNLQKGDVLANISDFNSLTVDVIDRKTRIHPIWRDHGHGTNIVRSLTGALGGTVPGETLAYVGTTARFFLAVRQAVESGERVVLSRDGIIGEQQ